MAAKKGRPRPSDGQGGTEGPDVTPEATEPLRGPALDGEASPTQLPLTLIQALIAEADPYTLLGREYARRVQLEAVVTEMRAWLQALTGQEV